MISTRYKEKRTHKSNFLSYVPYYPLIFMYGCLFAGIFAVNEIPKTPYIQALYPIILLLIVSTLFIIGAFLETYTLTLKHRNDQTIQKRNQFIQAKWLRLSQSFGVATIGFTSCWLIGLWIPQFKKLENAQQLALLIVIGLLFIITIISNQAIREIGQKTKQYK